MKRSSQPTTGNSTGGFTCLILIAIIGAALAAGKDDQSISGKIVAASSSRTQIECTTPDGRVFPIRADAGTNQNGAAFLTDNETLTCALHEGRTTFVIKLPTTSQHDCFTFVNENATAAGNLKIAVSDVPLAATSPKWVEVAGDVAFSHKRLFNVSTVGVEAHYLKLSFDVAKAVRLAAADH